MRRSRLSPGSFSCSVQTGKDIHTLCPVDYLHCPFLNPKGIQIPILYAYKNVDKNVSDAKKVKLHGEQSIYEKKKRQQTKTVVFSTSICYTCSKVEYHNLPNWERAGFGGIFAGAIYFFESSTNQWAKCVQIKIIFSMKEENILSDKENSILEYIVNDSAITQRIVAKAENISVGKINSVLKNLIETGCLKAEKQNHRVRYVVTEFGVQTLRAYRQKELEAIICKSNEYLARLELLLREIAHKGFCRVMLQDMEYLRPMLEYVCLRTGFELVNEADSDVFVIKEISIK